MLQVTTGPKQHFTTERPGTSSGELQCAYLEHRLTSFLIFINFSLHSLLDSNHIGYYGMHEGMRLTPLDQQYRFFEKLNFPITEETEAWKEKVSVTLICL